MKFASSFHRNAGSFLCLGLLAGFSLRADPVDPKSAVEQSEAEQQDIRSHTTAISTQIQGLIDELTANGISGDDNKVLQSTKAALNHLSGPEMAQVIASLQQAGQASSATTTDQNAVKAYSDQKGIILQFQQILKEYAQRQAAYELPQRFKELSDQQTDALRTTTTVAMQTIGQTQSELTSMAQTTEQIVQTDQATIATEVAQAQAQLEKALQDSSGDEATTMQQALQDLKTGKLAQALNNANDDMKSGSLLKAIGDQKAARDQLRQIARDLNPPTDAVDALTAMAGDLAELIASQQKLLDQTNSSITTKTMDTDLAEKQVTLVDKADLLQQDMLSMSPDASGLVKESITPMQLSRSQLHDLGGFPQSTKAQQEVLVKLEDAQKLLQQQVADAQKAEDEANKDPLAKLQEMQQKVQAEIQQQQQISQQTTQTESAQTPDPANLANDQQKQSQLQQQTAATQQDAQAVSLPVSQALANAASQMDQAQKNLNDPAQAPAAQQAQANALAALNQANNQLGQQIAQAQQTPADPAALAAADSALQKAQDNTSAAQADTNTPPPGTPDTAAASQALGDAEKNAETAAATPGLPADAAQDVKDAQAQIGQGQKDADGKNAPGAASHAAAAQQALAQARASVAMAAAGLAANAQGPPGPSHTPGHMSIASAHITGGDNKKGSLHNVYGGTKFIALEKRERAAIGQSQEEKRPQEYAGMIDQYMKNLSDQSSAP